MGETSKIEWTDATWNPWHGCRKVSPGCKYCYMFRDKERYKQEPTTVLRSKANFNAPKSWKESKVVFTCSWSDWFIEEADPWRDEAWKIIKETPQHTYQILTKRPENIIDRLPEDWGECGYENVWLGVSTENVKTLNERLPKLWMVDADIQFLSCEPLLEDIAPALTGLFIEYGKTVDWIIIGGESGNETGKYRYRPSELQWYRNLINVCDQYGIHVFVKQLGTHLSKELGLSDRHGGNMDEFPPDLKFREMP